MDLKTHYEVYKAQVLKGMPDEYNSTFMMTFMGGALSAINEIGASQDRDETFKRIYDELNQFISLMGANEKND